MGADFLLGLLLYVAGTLTGALGHAALTEPEQPRLDYCVNDTHVIQQGDESAAWKALPLDIKKRVLEHDERLDANCQTR